MAIQDDGGKDVVAVGEDIGFDQNDVPGHTFSGKTAVIDSRRRPLDHDTTAAVETACRHEPASCELHALLASGEQRAAGGERVVQLEKQALRLAIAQNGACRKHMFVAGSLGIGLG